MSNPGSTVVEQAAGGSWQALWRRPRYRSFTLTVAALRLVSMMFATSGVLLVLDRTHDPALAGLMSAASTVPGVVTGPLLGAWLDVVARRRPLIVVDQLLGAAGLIVVVVLAGHAPDWTVPVSALLFGLTSPISNGSISSAINELAGPGLLDQAAAMQATTINVALLAGPALAAVLIGFEGPARVIELQAVLTVIVALAVAVNPAFEVRPAHQPERLVHALRDGTRALLGRGILRDAAISNMLGNFGYGLLIVAFPLWAAGALHGHHNDGGYLWAALAAGSIVGTFIVPGRTTTVRVARAYLALGLSALLWYLAASVWVGIVLVLVSGVLDGPAYAGAVTLRQRHAPDVARTQVLNTVGSFVQVAISAGAIVGGTIHRPAVAFAIFCGVQLAAAVLLGLRPRRRPSTADPNGGRA